MVFASDVFDVVYPIIFRSRKFRTKSFWFIPFRPKGFFLCLHGKFWSNPGEVNFIVGGSLPVQRAGRSHRFFSRKNDRALQATLARFKNFTNLKEMINIVGAFLY